VVTLWRGVTLLPLSRGDLAAYHMLMISEHFLWLGATLLFMAALALLVVAG